MNESNSVQQTAHESGSQFVAATDDSPLALPMASRRVGVVGFIFGLFLIVFTLFILDGLIISFAYPEAEVSELESLAVAPAVLQVMKWSSAFVTLAGFLLFAMSARIPLASFGITKTPLGSTALFGLAAVILSYAPQILVMTPFVIHEKSQFTSDELRKKIEFMEIMTAQSRIQITFLMIAVAIHEELIFRALLIPCLKRIGMPFAAANLISAAIFGLLHSFGQGWTGAMATFGIGLVFGTIFVLSRSLWVVILAHFIFNFTNSMVVNAFDLEEVRKELESIAPIESMLGA